MHAQDAYVLSRFRDLKEYCYVCAGIEFTINPSNNAPNFAANASHTGTTRHVCMWYNTQLFEGINQSLWLTVNRKRRVRNICMNFLWPFRTKKSNY